jgi:hypothetical protein
VKKMEIVMMKATEIARKKNMKTRTELYFAYVLSSTISLHQHHFEKFLPLNV